MTGEEPRHLDLLPAGLLPMKRILSKSPYDWVSLLRNVAFILKNMDGLMPPWQLCQHEEPGSEMSSSFLAQKVCCKESTMEKASHRAQLSRSVHAPSNPHN